ncbi:MAG TPA: hypothetical protein VNW53_11285 [Phenylobacterium sp.]|jgi:hypothetical protein|uniref:hypothetical protein n=1 Tax=Phenylobacterium sp. TaxID=1871053 RepID=UPI002B707444|nr:hypothetical protein [Phenylobacterium sp.]HXA39575.1 hypothetical protein [Phenylobacterium sp.]
MIKRLRRLVLPLLILAGPAHAAEKPKEVGQYVDLQPVAMPIVIDGRLVNYVFVYVRVNLKGGADIIKARDREPAFRDALVRDGHRTPFVLANDWSRIDEAKLIAAMTRDAAAITGPGVVASVSVTSQTPQKRVMPPRPTAPDHP